MRIAVVGLGKIGLPLAVQYATKGHQVFGADINPLTVDLVNQGVEPFPGEDQLAEKLREVVSSGLLTATTDTAAAVSESEVVVVVVPLFVDDDGRPDFGWMDAATQAIATGLQSGTLVSYETTLPVGTTRTRYVPMLEDGSGLVADENFHLVFSPERVLTGRIFADLSKYPKLVGGISSDSEKRGIEFYESVLDFDDRVDLPKPNGVWPMGSAEAAEMAKLAETTYRDVNIGLANQFAKFADKTGIDVYAVIEACNSQPYSHIHRPGIAVGGHCIPVYPRLYMHKDPDATIVAAAREVNAGMPSFAVSRLQQQFDSLSGATVAILGAAYRGHVKETAFSGVFALASELALLGAIPLVHDPLYTAEEVSQLGLNWFEPGMPVAAAILHTEHQEYQEWTTWELPGVRVILDGRRFLRQAQWGDVRLIGIGYKGGVGD